MNNKKGMILLLFALVFILVGAGILYRQLGQNVIPEQLATQAPPETETVEEPTASTEAEAPDKVMAPNFTVYDLQGNAVQLSDFFGKPIVLNFWASWCGPCKMEMPDFHEKYLEIGEEVQFLMVNMTDGSGETVETASAFVAEQAYTFPVFYDTQADATAAYGVYSLPTTYFIDAEGCAIAQATGAIDSATLQRGIDMIYSAF